MSFFFCGYRSLYILHRSNKDLNIRNYEISIVGFYENIKMKIWIKNINGMKLNQNSYIEVLIKSLKEDKTSHYTYIEVVLLKKIIYVYDTICDV